MRIEQELFASYRVEKEKLINYGFENFNNIFVFSKGFLNGDFKAKIVVDENENISVKVIDNAFNEEFIQLNNESYHGGFIGTVRESYKEYC